MHMIDLECDAVLLSNGNSLDRLILLVSIVVRATLMYVRK